MDPFSRSALLLGEEAMEQLKRAHVAVFGIGGVGSFVAEGLARGGVGRLTLIDDDVVSLTNLNRQLVALHSTLGQNKAEVMASRIADINPAAAVTVQKLFYLPDSPLDFSVFDYVVDAIDTVSSKLSMIECCLTAHVPVISSMGTGNKLDPARLKITDISKTSVCPLAKVMRKELRKRGINHVKVLFSDEVPLTPLAACQEPPSSHGKRQTPGSVSFVPPVAGLMIAGTVIRDLIGLQDKAKERTEIE